MLEKESIQFEQYSLPVKTDYVVFIHGSNKWAILSVLDSSNEEAVFVGDEKGEIRELRLPLHKFYAKYLRAEWSRKLYKPARAAVAMLSRTPTPEALKYLERIIGMETDFDYSDKDASQILAQAVARAENLPEDHPLREMPAERFKSKAEAIACDAAVSEAVKRCKGEKAVDVSELRSLSERRLAEEYQRVVGEGPKRIKIEDKEAKIKELVEAAKKAGETVIEDKPKPARKNKKKKEQEPALRKVSEREALRSLELGEATDTVGSVVKEKKETRSPLTKTEPGENPFRPGTNKYKGYEFYLHNHADKQKCIDFLLKLGASESTAKGWVGSAYKNALGA